MADIDDLLAQLNDNNGQKTIIVDENLPVVIAPTTAPAEVMPIIDVVKHVQNFERISSEILGSWRADREEAQSAINLLRDMIEDVVARGQSPTGTWLEAYVGAIKAKTDANATATKLLDSTIKIIQMNKPTVNIKSTTNTINYNDLNSVLAEPIREDDV